jgi:LEA14-like dessication related protein
MKLNKYWKATLLFLSFWVYFYSAVDAQSKIEFVKIKEVKVDRLTLSDLELSAKVVIYNHLRLAAKVKDIQVDVYLNDVHVGTIYETNVEKIRKKQASDIPLELNTKVLKNISNLFNNAGDILLGKSLKIEYQGKVTVRALGIIKKELRFKDDLFFKLSELM